MEIVLYTGFSKRNNSTKTPLADGFHVSGELKEPSSVESPNIRFNYDLLGAQIKATYAYIVDFERFYFINNWRWESGFWIAEMSVDVLASFREDILGTSAYVLFSSSSYNEAVPDSRISFETKSSVSRSTASIPWAIGVNGVYYINVVAADGGPGCTTYAADYASIGTLINYLSIDDGTELKDQVTQLFGGGTMNAILSCNWTPIETDRGVPNTSIKIGNVATPATARSASDIQYNTSISINWPFSDFRRSSAYCKIEMWLPFVGKVSLPVDEFSRSSTISIKFVFDVRTCNFVYTLVGNSGGFAFYSGSCGYSISISSFSVDAIGALNSAANTVGSALSLDIGDAASGLFNTVMCMETPTLSTVGGNSGAAAGRAMLNDNLSTIYLDLIYYKASAEPSSMADVHGRPLYKMTGINSLIGYVQTANASVSSPSAYDSEKDQINSLLDGGVYIE